MTKVVVESFVKQETRIFHLIVYNDSGFGNFLSGAFFFLLLFIFILYSFFHEYQSKVAYL